MTRFVIDSDETVVLEAARAINDDGSIEGALPALARILEDKRFAAESILRRAISANLASTSVSRSHAMARQRKRQCSS